jgi:hypothetical protein
MSRTIITKSGSEFITSIGTERFIAILCKEVGAKYEEDPMGFGPVMAYEMTEEEVNDAVYRIKEFLYREKYFRFFNKIKDKVFGTDATIETFVTAVECVVDDLRQSNGYECVS